MLLFLEMQSWKFSTIFNLDEKEHQNVVFFVEKWSKLTTYNYGLLKTGFQFCKLKTWSKIIEQDIIKFNFLNSRALK